MGDFNLVPKERVELSWDYSRAILSRVRLPFRHSGKLNLNILP
jgi:hypothetical protein